MDSGKADHGHSQVRTTSPRRAASACACRYSGTPNRAPGRTRARGSARQRASVRDGSRASGQDLVPRGLIEDDSPARRGTPDGIGDGQDSHHDPSTGRWASHRAQHPMTSGRVADPDVYNYSDTWISGSPCWASNPRSRLLYTNPNEACTPHPRRSGLPGRRPSGRQAQRGGVGRQADPWSSAAGAGHW